MLALIGAAQTHLGVAPHVLVIRAWAIGVPAALAWLLFVTPDAEDDPATYRRFWDGIGRDFPVLTGAASTDYYFRNETRLLSEQLPTLAGCRLLKSDLWDEAKNTQILQWAAARGARVFGVDVSPAVVGQARAAFGPTPLGASVADVRRLPFGDDSFDAIYSMGTIEHFAESEAALVEMIRVLRPGGRIVLGVPNRYDPFGRPILVAALSRVGLYAYGFEKSVLPPPAARDASAVGGRGGRRDRHPFHAGVAAHARSGIALLVPSPDMGDKAGGRGLCLARSACAARPATRLSVGLGWCQARAEDP